MRTNIDIDDELMARAMAATDSHTKKAVVEQGLQLLVQLKGQESLNALRGKVVWRGHDDDWFASDEEILEKRRLERNGQVQQDTALPNAAPVYAGPTCASAAHDTGPMPDRRSR
jgi:Arc/MetJ family transcription regulator